MGHPSHESSGYYTELWTLNHGPARSQRYPSPRRGLCRRGCVRDWCTWTEIFHRTEYQRGKILHRELPFPRSASVCGATHCCGKSPSRCLRISFGNNLSTNVGNWVRMYAWDDKIHTIATMQEVVLVLRSHWIGGWKICLNKWDTFGTVGSIHQKWDVLRLKNSYPGTHKKHGWAHRRILISKVIRTDGPLISNREIFCLSGDRNDLAGTVKSDLTFLPHLERELQYHRTWEGDYYIQYTSGKISDTVKYLVGYDYLGGERVTPARII